MIMLCGNGTSMSGANAKLFDHVKNGTLTEKILEALIKEGANLNVQNIDGDTPLHYAVNKGDMQTAAKLLVSCANMDVKNNNGLTPFEIAAIGAYPNRVDLLIWRGFSILDDQGGFKQGIVTGTEKYVKIAQLFIECKLLLDHDAKEPDFIEQRKDLLTYWNGCKVNKVLRIPLQDNEINGEATTPHTSRNVNPLNPTAAQGAFHGVHVMCIEPWYYNIDMELIKHENINVKVEDDDEYAIIKFLDKIQDDKGRLNLVLSALFDRKGDMDHELQSRITSRFQNLCGGAQKSTTVIATPTAPSGDVENKTQNLLNPQITTNKPQGESNVYNNKGFGKEIMGVVGAIVGAIIGATIAYLAGAATLPIIAAIAVFSAVPGVLIGYGIAEICEKVRKEQQNDPKKGILTALSIMLTPEWLNGNVATKT